MQKDNGKNSVNREGKNEQNKAIHNKYTKPLKPLITIEQSIDTDPFGSWTGVPTDDYFDKPVQDVDDL